MLQRGDPRLSLGIRGRVLPVACLGDFPLGAQVAERQLQVWEADQQEKEEEEEARRAEQLTAALLQQEAKMMAKQGYRPKVGSRSAGPALLVPVCSPGHGLFPSTVDSSLLLCSCFFLS